MVKLTKRDLGIIAGLAGAADFLAEGRFSAPVARALKTAVRRVAPVAARSTAAFIPRAVGKTIALRHPVLTGGAIAYYTYQNRDEIGSLVEQGYEIVQPAVSSGLQTLADLDAPIVGVKTRKKQTKFNKAVSKGMKIVKGSTSYGKKGTINNAKKAFSAVTKVASAASKKKKMPKKGITRKIYMGIKGLVK